MKTEDLLSVLEQSREHLTDIKNWCPRGSGESPTQCAMVTPTRFVPDQGSDFSSVKVRLADACQELYNTREVAGINDGAPYTVTSGLDDPVRHLMILAIYDRAIQNVKDEQDVNRLVRELENKKCSGPSVIENFRRGVDFCREQPEWAELVSGKYHKELIQKASEIPSMNATAAAFYRAAFEESSKNVR